MNPVSHSPLGKQSPYITQYAPELLFPIPREDKRSEIGVHGKLPFHGFDIWNAYEISWLNPRGKPVVAVGEITLSAATKHLIESKSFKLYLNSLNQTRFESMEQVTDALARDLTHAAQGEVRIALQPLASLTGKRLGSFSGDSLDDQDIACTTYTLEPAYLSADPSQIISESLHSDLLKSNCLVTGQPDWGSVQIQYQGPKIHHEGLLKYLVSYREHNEFHEQCVERIFMDILRRCQPHTLTVEARYTRRGGLDINPIRSTQVITPTTHLRMARQ